MTEPGNLCGSGHTVPNPCLALVPCDWLLFKPGYIAISPSLTSVALNYYVHDFWLQGYLIAKIKITSYSIMDNSVMFIHTHLYSWVYMRQTYDNHVCQCVVSVCVCVSYTWTSVFGLSRKMDLGGNHAVVMSLGCVSKSCPWIHN